MHTFLMVLIMLVSVIPLPAREVYHCPVAHDDTYLLMYQMPHVDIPVLGNDIGPGQNNLRVIAVTVDQGGTAEIVDGTTVRISIDWASYLMLPSVRDSGPTGRVAHGVYIVSNGYAQSRARWTVWYMPDMSV